VKRRQAEVDADQDVAEQIAKAIERWLAEGRRLRAEVLRFARGSARRQRVLVDAINEHVASERDPADWWKDDDDHGD
jgi:hypothetical protein